VRVKRPTYEELERMVEKLKKESHVRTQAEETLRESEKLYRFLTENTNDMITRHLPDSTYLFISPACRTLFGYTSEELLGTKAFDLIHPEDVKRVITISQEAVRTGELRMGQYRHLKKDGQYIWVETVGNVIKNEVTGDIKDIICVVRDITERKQAEEALRESEEKTRSILRVAPVGIGVVRDKILEDVNFCICEMTGYSKEELVGNSARMLYPSQEDFDYVGTEKYRQIAERGTGVVETRWIKKDGNIIDILLASTPMDINDYSKGITFTALDITERKRAAEALQESEQKYRTLFESSTDAIMMLTKDGFFDGNQAAFDLFGFSSKEDFVKMHPSELSPPTQPDGKDSLTASLQHIETAFAKGKDSFEWIHKKTDGTLFPAEVRLSSLLLGEKTVLQGLVRDITDRKRAEEENKKYQTLFETSNDAIMMMNEDRFVDGNQATLDLFGFTSKADFITKSPADLSPPTQADGTDSLTAQKRHLPVAS